MSPAEADARLALLVGSYGMMCLVAGTQVLSTVFEAPEWLLAAAERHPDGRPRHKFSIRPGVECDVVSVGRLYIHGPDVPVAQPAMEAAS